jgi:general secretion pathway protein H
VLRLKPSELEAAQEKTKILPWSGITFPSLGRRIAGSPRARAPGFTLLELLIVIAVLALIGGLVLAHGPGGSERLEADAAVTRLASSLRLARSEAIARGHPVSLSVDVAGYVYAVDGSAPVSLPPSVSLSVTAVAAETAGRRIAAIRFLPDGSSTGGRIDIGSPGRHSTIRVDWLTGRVSMRDAP